MTDRLATLRTGKRPSRTEGGCEPRRRGPPEGSPPKPIPSIQHPAGRQLLHPPINHPPTHPGPVKASSRRPATHHAVPATKAGPPGLRGHEAPRSNLETAGARAAPGVEESEGSPSSGFTPDARHRRRALLRSELPTVPGHPGSESPPWAASALRPPIASRVHHRPGRKNRPNTAANQNGSPGPRPLGAGGPQACPETNPVGEDPSNHRPRTGGCTPAPTWLETPGPASSKWTASAARPPESPPTGTEGHATERTGMPAGPRP